MGNNDNYNVEEILNKIWRIEEFGLGTTYLVEGTEKALLIDTGTGAADLKGLVESVTTLPYDVVLTHGHVDHAGGKRQFDKVYIDPLDLKAAKEITADERKGYASAILKAYPAENSLFDIESINDNENDTNYVLIDEGFIFDLGDRKIEVIKTPGHTPGSISLLDSKSKVLFSGDSFQPITLLAKGSGDGKEVLSKWVEGAEKVFEKRDNFNYMCGGHEKITSDLIDDLLICVKGILDGQIIPEHTRIHIFEGMFAHYGKVHVTYQEFNIL